MLPHKGRIEESSRPAVTHLPTTPKGRKVEARKARMQMLHGINGDHLETGTAKNVGGIPGNEKRTRVLSGMVTTQ